MTNRLLLANALVEDPHNPIVDIAACFPGHGSQSINMFQGCLSNFPEAQRVIAQADSLYKERYGELLSTTVNSGKDNRLTMPTVMQPAIVTASLAMFAVLKSAGIPISMLMGHSLGEYSALIASDAITFDDGLSAVMDRAETIDSIPYAMRGAMAVVLPHSTHDMHRIKAIVTALSCQGPLSIGIINSNKQLVISGVKALVVRVTERLAAESIESSILPIPVGFHSPVLSPVLMEFKRKLENYQWRKPNIPVISTITQGPLQDSDIEHMPQLLAGQLVTPFDFRDSVTSCLSMGAKLFVDMGPKRIITNLIADQVRDGEAKVFGLDYGPKGGAKTIDRIQALQWLYDTQESRQNAAPEPSTPSPHTSKVTASDLRNVLLDAICEVTGYPAEVISPDLDLEADLGIDSVKQMQALGTVAEQIGVQPESLDLSQAHTLRQIVDCIKQAAASSRLQKEEQTNTEEFHSGESVSNVKRFIPQIIDKPLSIDLGVTDWSNSSCLFIQSGNQVLDSSIQQTLQPIFRTMHTITADKLISGGGYPTAEFGTIQMILDCHSLNSSSPAFGEQTDAWLDTAQEKYAQTFKLSQSLYPLIEQIEGNIAWLSVTGAGGVSGVGTTGSGDPVDTLASGFYKSLGKELNNLKVKTLDVDSYTDTPKAILDEVRHYYQDQDCEMGYLHGCRHVVRVIPLGTRQKYSIRKQLPAGTVAFFSGGSRGIALECAKALADEQPQINVVITGRSDINDPQAKDWLHLSEEEWNKAKADFFRESKRNNPSLGAIELSEEYNRISHIRTLANNLKTAISTRSNLHYIPCDIADAQSTDNAVRKARKQWGNLSLVVHAAGLESFGRLPGKTLSRTQKSIAVKLGGFINLYQATKDEPSLTAFISFGSVSGRFGMDGQVDYTAAAATLSALSHTIPMNTPANQKIPFVTMEWSAWSQVGMAAHPQVIAVQKQERGMEYIPVKVGTEFFLDELALGTADPEVLIMGALGSNQPQGQLDSLDADMELASPIDSAGTVLDKPHYPMLDSVDKRGENALVAHRMLRYDRDLYLPDHRVKGVTTFPGVLHLETQIEAASCLSNVKRLGVELEELELKTFLKCRDNDEVPITIEALRTDRKGSQVITTELYSTFKAPDGRVLIPHRTHSTATFKLLDKAPESYKADWNPDSLFEKGTLIDIARYHARTEHFISFGPTFRYMRVANLTGDNCAIGEFIVPSVPGLFSDVRNPQFLCCPLLIDNVGRMALMREFQRWGRHVVPVQIHGARQFRCPAAGEVCYGKMVFLAEDEKGVNVSIEIIDANGYLLCQADEVRLTFLGPVEQKHNIITSADSVIPSKEY